MLHPRRDLLHILVRKHVLVFMVVVFTRLLYLIQDCNFLSFAVDIVPSHYI